LSGGTPHRANRFDKDRRRLLQLSAAVHKLQISGGFRMTNAVGAVGHPNDENGAYLDDPKSYAGKGWQNIWGFLDGVRGVTDRAEGITGDVAGIVTKYSEADRSLWELRRDKSAFGQDQFLEMLKVNRGDNIKQYYVIGAVALAAVVLFK